MLFKHVCCLSVFILGFVGCQGLYVYMVVRAVLCCVVACDSLSLFLASLALVEGASPPFTILALSACLPT